MVAGGSGFRARLRGGAGIGSVPDVGVEGRGPGEIRVRVWAYSTSTAMPGEILRINRAMSQFATRMQPWLKARPIVSGWLVP
jgi:hypothetical protein